MRIPDARHLGHVFKEARLAKGLTQGEVAEMACMNQTTISLIESGNTASKLKTLLHLMAVLDLQMDISHRVKTVLKGDQW